jgi:hypothetical protein
MLTTPGGTSAVARHSANSMDERMRLRRDQYRGVAADDDGREPGDETEERWLGCEDPGDSRGFRHREVEVRAGDRIGGADDLRELVGPARVPDHAVDRGNDLLRPGAQRRELGLPRLHHLGDAVQDLAAVVRRHPGPSRACLVRDAHRVAQILPRSSRDVGPFGEIRAPRLRTRERAADEELVGLLDGKAFRHASSSTT